jgi:predicted negative regulator of RcsB-dependent stress response
MKAERRHELQENSLIRGVRNFPDFWRAYGSKILLGVILVLLAILLIRMWINKRTESRKQMSEDLTAARASLEELRSTNELPNPRPGMQMDPESMQPMKPEQVADHRKRVWNRVDAAVNNVLQNASDAAQLAEAKLLRADLNYHFGLLADLGANNGANKARGIDSPPKEYFERAAQNYQEVIAQASNVRPGQVAAARLGLAAVHENRKQFSEARALYETVRNEAPDEISKLQAAARLKALQNVKPDQFVATEPLTFLPPPPPKMPASTQSGTQPATQSGAATQSSTTQSAATLELSGSSTTTLPATRPATVPSTAP